MGRYWGMIATITLSKSFKQSFIKCFIYYLLRSHKQLNALPLHPLLNHPEVVQLAHLPLLPLAPTHEVRKNVGIHPAHKYSVYYVAQEHFQLQRCSFSRVLGVLLVYLLIDSAYSVAIAHLEFGEILVPIVEPLLKTRDILYALLALFELLY